VKENDHHSFAKLVHLRAAHHRIFRNSTNHLQDGLPCFCAAITVARTHNAVFGAGGVASPPSACIFTELALRREVLAAKHAVLGVTKSVALE
jgi:hypothetical protein